MDYSQTLERVIAWAALDDNIRTVVLTGSAAEGTDHPLSDRDLELHVRDLEALETHDGWWSDLGEVLAVERLHNHNAEPTRLVYYVGGKLDFTLVRAGRSRLYGRPFSVLLDKDGATAVFRLQRQHRDPPNQGGFDECCNWACAAALMTAKAIVRDEPWSAFSRRADLMTQLLRLIEWDHLLRYQGVRDIRHLGTRLRHWMDVEVQHDLEAATVWGHGPAADDALLTSFDLFATTADRVARIGGLSAFPLTPVRSELQQILALRDLRHTPPT